jgi:F-type H+-transporting ATPase subunit epsilon
MSFQCTIVTPEQQAFDASVTQVILPAFDGQLGVLTDRAPLLAKLGAGPLRIDVAGQGGGTRYFFVDGGVAQMKDNKLTVLTNEATPAADIDTDAARAEYAEAAARVATDPKTAEDRERQMNRARAKQAVAGLK